MKATNSIPPDPAGSTDSSPSSVRQRGITVFFLLSTVGNLASASLAERRRGIPASSSTTHDGSRRSSQEVCPWNERFPAAQQTEPGYETTAWPADGDEDAPLPALEGPDLVDLTERILAMSGKEYRRVFAESPLARPGRKGMLRNLCVALGNYGGTSADAASRVRPLLTRVAADPSELVREHAAWGLGRLVDNG